MEISKILDIDEQVLYRNNYTKRVNLRKINMMSKILTTFNESRNTYGANRIKWTLSEEGEKVSTKTVSSYMKELNLIPNHQKKILLNRRVRSMKMSDRILDNKVRYIKPTHINQVWTGDITEIKTLEGKCYLATIMDKYSRKIISYEISDKMDANLCIAVLKKAVDIRKPNEKILIHTDKGTQYRSFSWINCVESFGGILSYTRPDFNCADNAVQESFHASLKKEELYIRPIKNIEEARERVTDYIDNFYNSKRVHTALKTCPDNFERKSNNISIINDVNLCEINRIDLKENITEKEKDRMYKNLLELGYVNNERYPDLNEKIREYKKRKGLL